MDKPDNRTNKRKVGDIGENVACEFLLKRGFEVVKRNYLRKWGELDIIAKRNGIYRFIEVKTGSHVPHVTSSFRPEENVHPQKLRRIYRAIQTYMLENSLDCDFQIDVIVVHLDTTKRNARVEMIENIVG
jgi:putative endonuclease